MDLLCVFLLWILAVVPTLASSCISRSAVCCMVGEVEGKIFFDEIEGPGCSNRGKVQVIVNLIGLRSQGYNNNNNNRQGPFYNFRIKTYGEILPECSGLGKDFGYNSGHIATLQPFEDGSIYNDTTFLPGASSGFGTNALIGRSVALYQGRPSRRPNQRPLACCVIGRGQPVSLPLPSPAKPTPLGPNNPIDLSVGQQTKDPFIFKPDAINQNQDGGTANHKPGITITPNNQGFYPNNFQTNNNNNAFPNSPNKPITLPRNDQNFNNNVNNNKNGASSKKMDVDNTFDAGNKKNPKYKFDEDDIDKKFNLIGGYGGDGSNFEFDSYNPRNERGDGMGNTYNNNGDFSNVYNQGSNNYNTNTAGVFGLPTNPQANSNSQSNIQPNNDGRGSFAPNNNFNSFDTGANRNRGFGNSQFPSVFGSIGSGNFFNLDGKLAGANLINGNPRSSKGLGQAGDGALGSSLATGFEPPKGPSFQDIYNKPTGESPLSSGGFSDTVSPEKENSISSLFFSDPQIKDTIGLTSDDKFIPRESEDEEESTSYRSQSDSGDEEPNEAGPDFDTDANSLSTNDEYDSNDDNNNNNDNSLVDSALAGVQRGSSINDPTEDSNEADSVVDIRPSN